MVPEKSFLSKFVSDQIWYYLFLDGLVGSWFSQKEFLVRICIKPNLVLSHFGCVCVGGFSQNLHQRKSGVGGRGGGL